MKKILALVGSNSTKSINNQLAAYTLSLFEGAQTTLVDMKGIDVPIYNPDLEGADGVPEPIQALFDQIQEQDALVVASPEYNGSIPAAFKNVIDWLSRVKMNFLGGKPVLLLSTSPGKNGGATNLSTMKPLMGWWGGNVVDSHSFGNFFDIYDQAKNTLQGEADLKLKEIAKNLEGELAVV